MEKKDSKTRSLVRMAIVAAVICVLAPLSIPIGPVPLSLTNFVIFLAIYLLGWKMALGSVACYLLIGLVGLPVFSGFTGGIAKLAGPTGGYLIGFLPMAAAAGVVIEKSSHKLVQLAGLILGTAVCYAFGTAWFCVEAGVGLEQALKTCVLIFIPGDFLKMLLAIFMGPWMRRALKKAGVL